MESWSMRVDALVYHVASGRAFFSGMILLVVTVGILAWLPEDSRWRRRMAIPIILGLLLIALSATPLPWWLYGVTGSVFAAWIIIESCTAATSRKIRLASRLLVLAVLLGAAAWEAPYHLAPRIDADNIRAVAVIGDSVTAGIGEDEAVTWPEMLRNTHGITIHDHAKMGATVSSALEQGELLTPNDGIVILEIGGNDLLSGTSPEDYEQGLEKLLKEVAIPGRTAIMFELPLPPTFNRYGLIQRRLAEQYQVHLIPKRVLMGILTEENATLDSIHLSQAGHARMASIIWKLIQPAFPAARRE